MNVTIADPLTRDTRNPGHAERLLAIDELFGRGLVPGGRTVLDFHDPNGLRAVTQRDADLSGFTTPPAGRLSLLEDELRDSLVVRCGARVLPLGLVAGPVNIPTPIDLDKAGGWGTAPTNVEPSTLLTTMSPHRCWALITLSEQLIRQSGIIGAEFANQQLMHAIASEIDRAAFAGDGTDDQPIGLFNDPDVVTLAGGPAAPSLTRFAAMRRAIVEAGVVEGIRLTLLVAPDVEEFLLETPAFAGAGGSERSMHAELSANYNVHSSIRVPDGSVVMGKFSDLVVCLWGGIELLVNPFSRDTEGFTRLIASAQIDVAPRRPESFILDTGLVLS